jgi:hypothetical protein
MNPADQVNAGWQTVTPDGEADRAAARALEQRSATAMGENTEWLNAHQAEILQEHPDWADKYVAVASGTPSKILAVGDNRSAVIEQGLQDPELLELARREGLRPGDLLSALLLDVTCSLYDR